MKKFIFLIATMCVVCSCATTSITSITKNITMCIGDVTAYNADGSILNKWEDVVISSNNEYPRNSVFKTFGINFYDTKSEKFIIVGNAVPCTIEYIISVSSIKEIVKAKEVNIDQYNRYSKRRLVDEYRALGEYISNTSEKLSTLDKNSSEFEILKEDIRQTQIKQKLIYFIYYNRYGVEINTII